MSKRQRQLQSPPSPPSSLQTTTITTVTKKKTKHTHKQIIKELQRSCDMKAVSFDIFGFNRKKTPLAKMSKTSSRLWVKMYSYSNCIKPTHVKRVLNLLNLTSFDFLRTQRTKDTRFHIRTAQFSSFVVVVVVFFSSSLNVYNICDCVCIPMCFQKETNKTKQNNQIEFKFVNVKCKCSQKLPNSWDIIVLSQWSRCDAMRYAMLNDNIWKQNTRIHKSHIRHKIPTYYNMFCKHIFAKLNEETQKE